MLNNLKLNIDQYKTDIASNKVKNKIDFDMALGRKHGVAATPTFYINGKNTEMAALAQLNHQSRKP